MPNRNLSIPHSTKTFSVLLNYPLFAKHSLQIISLCCHFIDFARQMNKIDLKSMYCRCFTESICAQRMFLPHGYGFTTSVTQIIFNREREKKLSARIFTCTTRDNVLPASFTNFFTLKSGIFIFMMTFVCLSSHRSLTWLKCFNLLGNAIQTLKNTHELNSFYARSYDSLYH